MQKTALYIHIPFCKQKCLYCDFTSFCGKEDLMISYVDSLCKEIISHRERKFNTIFIGGGTPTFLNSKALVLLKECISKLNLSKDLEFTVEGNPGTFEKEKLEILKDMGVNRLSIGLQTYEERLLKNLGRIHNIDDFLTSFTMARKLGFNNINVDLMFGLPEQTLQDWKHTLEKVCTLSPEHLSCYSLIIEENTPYFNLLNDKKLRLPDEEEERKMYYTTLEYLKAKGYEQYEISNYAKKGKECRHNLVYWNLDQYIGCGVAAHSYIDGYRIGNVENIEQYIENINNGQTAILEKNKNSIKDDMEEFMFMGLRKIKGINKTKFKTKFNKDIYEIYDDVINKYNDLGLIIDEEDNLYLSPKGIELSNLVMSEFLLED